MSPMRLSKVEGPLRTVLAFNHAFNRHDVAGMMALVSVDCVFETSTPAPDGILVSGRDAIAHYYQDFLRQSPAAQMEIEDIYGLGLRCIMHWRYAWVDADGERQHVRGVDIFRLKNRLICEISSYAKR